MLTFIRGENTFVGPGQIYVKLLPNGEPVQLTHDDLYKMSPVFFPSGDRIAYTTEAPSNGMDTWVVPSMRTKALSRDTCSPQCFAAPLGSQSGGGPKL